MVSLKPLEPDSGRAIPGFAVCDIESSNWINFLVIGLAWKKYDSEDKLEEQKYLSFQDMREFCEFVFTKEQPHSSIFAHFGGRFDFSFALKEYFFMNEKYHIGTIIPRGSGLLCFEVSTFYYSDTIPDNINEKDLLGKDRLGKFKIRDRTITFRDSSAMLPFGLASLTENFGVEHKKKEIDYEKIEKVDDELLEYLEYDCWGLYEVIERYFRWDMVRQAGPAFTVASQALRVFRTFLKDEIPSISPRIDEFVRDSYFGGRTEIFKPFFEQHKDNELLKSFDVNSLYPAVMRAFDFPGGFHFETNEYYEDKMGFYDVEVYVPDMYVPPLGIRFNNLEDKLIFPTGRFRGKFSVADLNYAMSLGVKIEKIHSGVIFKNAGPIFREYIEFLYDMRKRSEKASVDNVLCKLLMNSSYGRFGLNLEREQLVFDDNSEGMSPFMDINIDKEGNNIIRLASKEVVLDSSFSNVAIAAWVTSQARVWMHKLIMENPEGMYYMDTDSLKTTHNYPRNDADLGQLKLEYKSKRACFILPKTYIEDTTLPMFKVYDKDGKEQKGIKSTAKIVMKGFDKRKISNFTTEDFTAALEGDLRRLRAINPKKFATLKTAIKRNKFLDLINEQPKQIRSKYTKRRIYKRAYAQVYDTEPLNIKNGAVTNLDMDTLKKWKDAEADSMGITEAVYSKWMKERNS